MDNNEDDANKLNVKYAEKESHHVFKVIDALSKQHVLNRIELGYGEVDDASLQGLALHYHLLEACNLVFFDEL